MPVAHQMTDQIGHAAEVTHQVVPAHQIAVGRRRQGADAGRAYGGLRHLHAERAIDPLGTMTEDRPLADAARERGRDARGIRFDDGDAEPLEDDHVGAVKAWRRRPLLEVMRGRDLQAAGRERREAAPRRIAVEAHDGRARRLRGIAREADRTGQRHANPAIPVGTVRNGPARLSAPS